MTVRKCLLSLTLILVAAGGCGEKKSRTEKTDESGAESDGKKKSGEEGAKDGKVSWGKIERVPFTKLQPFLPEALGSLKRTNLAGQNVPDDERPWTEATAEYEGGDEKTLSISVQDNPLEAEETVSAKTTSFKGYPVTKETESDGNAELRFVVAGRFIVYAWTGKIPIGETRTLLEKLDFAKLESLKDHGKKK